MKTSFMDTTGLVSTVSNSLSIKTESSSQPQTNFSDIIDNLTDTGQKNTVDSLEQTKSGQAASKKDVNTDWKEKLESASDGVDHTETDETQVTSVKDESLVGEKLDSESKLDEASEKIKNILLDTLQISEEDLELAMQSLGLNFLDCLDQTNLAKLLTAISGSADISTLITSEGLYQQFNDSLALIGGVKESILADLGITDEELNALLVQAKEAKSNAAVVQTQVGQVTEETTVVTDKTAKPLENALTNLGVKSDEIVVKQEKTDQNVTSAASNEAGNAKAATTTAQTQNNGNNSEAQTEEQKAVIAAEPKKPEAQDDGVENYQKYVFDKAQPEATQSNVSEAALADAKAGATAKVDTESLMKQIQNQIKLSTSLDTTRLEFQLNPEHLGKLTIQLASKEGIVTAHITAQNQAVKEALESQIVQLRENMNNQGIKVSEVEVTVKSHEFERNLEEGNQNQNKEPYEQEQKNTRRQFNYNEPESLEDLTADEALIAEMMIGNGNSINYSA
ncbi:flagellar hook-length control protein FliK [Konateibacter massiliensis]|uniref:flagellar hook-length control protein FliK n=1 Tax=Konateibacter massiliensis TaxID=2002841 RepID=UPI000C15C6BF|nr:flagellar hook-length control protein FliK [Konateibacter massiliensis]